MPIGIDFGTTNSSIAYSDANGEVWSLRVREQREPFDAVVRTIVFDPIGERHVGASAIERAVAARNDRPLLRSFKADLDRQKLRKEIDVVETVVTDGYNAHEQGPMLQRVWKRRKIYHRWSRPEMIGSVEAVLATLLAARSVATSTGRAQSLPPSAIEGALRRLADPGDAERLYIGIPVAFGVFARRRILSALVATGVFGEDDGAYRRAAHKCRFVYEPLAISSTIDLVGDGERVLIVDHGGGTLDVALLEATYDAAGALGYRRLAVDGRRSAGDQLDACLREALAARDPRAAAQIASMEGDSAADKEIIARAFAIAKERLSSRPDTAMVLPGLTVEFSRREFEAAIADELAAVREVILRCLSVAGVRPADVAIVQMTGGSSLVPAVQRTVGEIFDRSTEVRHDRAGDTDSERDALTGVSRGLARFGFQEALEQTTPCTYSVYVGGASTGVPVLERGQVEQETLEAAHPIRVPIEPSRRAAFVLFDDLVQRNFVGAMTEVPLDGLREVEVRVAAARGRATAAFEVRDPNSHRLLGRFDPLELDDHDLRHFIEDDCESLPLGSAHETLYLSRPLREGDYVRYGRARAWVRSIRHVASGELVNETADLDPGPYVLTVHPLGPGGAVQLFREQQVHPRAGQIALD